MDISILASSALALVAPFLKKVGEGTARKIGEEIWTLIKAPFKSSNTDIDSLNEQDLEKALINKLQSDPNFKKELEVAVNNAFQQSNVQQNVNNQGVIDKQINITNMSGDIKF